MKNNIPPTDDEINDSLVKLIMYGIGAVIGILAMGIIINLI